MEPGGSSWRRRLHCIFGLDIRSLALFRIALGIVLLFDVIIRFQDVRAFYTDEGVLPRSVLPVYNQGMSVHMLDGSLPFQVVLFCLHGFAALALILGWYTRYVLPLAWFLTLSVQSRNTLALHGGDVLLRLLLFWSMFLPLGACYSLDGLSRSAPVHRRFVSMGTVAFILQMCFVYWFAFLLKWGAAWRQDGTALYMALSIGHFTTPLGKQLLEQHSLLSVLTFSTIILEGGGTFLLFVPWRNWLFRLLAIVSFISFHIGIGLTMRMGIFQPVCIVAWLVFLPSEFWDWLERRLRRKRPASARPPVAAPLDAGLSPAIVSLPGPINVLIGLLILYVFTWNMQTWGEPRRSDDPFVLDKLLGFRDEVQEHFPVQLHTLGHSIGLDQGWGLFAPQPGINHGWLVVVASLEDGRKLDLLRNGAPVSWQKPAFIADTYPNSRWRQYLMHLSYLQPVDFGARQSYMAYLAKTWKEEHPELRDRLLTIEVFSMVELTQPDYEQLTLQKWRLCKLDCATMEADLQPVKVEP